MKWLLSGCGCVKVTWFRKVAPQEFCHYLKVQTFFASRLNGFNGFSRCPLYWFPSMLAAPLCERTNHQCCSCRSIVRNDSENLILIGPRILQTSNGFVSPLSILWVESNSTGIPSLAHQNWNCDSGLWTCWSIPIDPHPRCRLEN